MIINIRHTGLVVRNVEKSVKFYRDLLKLKLWKRKKEKSGYIDNVVGIKGAILEWVKLKADDGSLIELLQYHHPVNKKTKVMNAPSNKLGCSHVAFTVKDVDELYKKMRKQGFHCNNMPHISPDGKAKVMYCHDPDGILLELVEEIP